MEGLFGLPQEHYYDNKDTNSNFICNFLK